jgi:diketogulonate reductase-like aldo/keto reductase
MSVSPFTNSTLSVGFGCAALGERAFEVVQMALEEGFRAFDTSEENEYWYNPQALGDALEDYFQFTTADTDECVIMREQESVCGVATCQRENLRISTKIPPWSLTSQETIRANARHSRKQLVGFCKDEIVYDSTSLAGASTHPFPLDVYYIHAPACWKGWHPRCDDPPASLLDLQSAWKAMEAVAGIDQSARRIGLSNVQPDELLDIIDFVHERKGQTNPPPRIPDVVQAYADPFQPADDLRSICKDHGIEFVSYSTLGTQHGGSQNPVLTSPIIQGLAAKHSRSTAEVVLSWALQKNMSVIPRSTKRKHIQELARLLDAHPTFLDDADMHQIESMANTM